MVKVELISTGQLKSKDRIKNYELRIMSKKATERFSANRDSWFLIHNSFYEERPIRFFSTGLNFPSFFRRSISLPRTILFRVRTFFLSFEEERERKRFARAWFKAREPCTRFENRLMRFRFVSFGFFSTYAFWVIVYLRSITRLLTEIILHGRTIRLKQNIELWIMNHGSQKIALRFSAHNS